MEYTYYVCLKGPLLFLAGKVDLFLSYLLRSIRIKPLSPYCPSLLPVLKVVRGTRYLIYLISPVLLSRTRSEGVVDSIVASVVTIVLELKPLVLGLLALVLILKLHRGDVIVNIELA